MLSVYHAQFIYFSEKFLQQLDLILSKNKLGPREVRNLPKETQKANLGSGLSSALNYIEYTI